MKLIVGLGNPGREYDTHRHNIGFWVVDALASERKLRWEKSFDVVLEACGDFEGEECWLVKPLTWMNRSGLAVQTVLKERGIELADLIVIHDDLDLKVGSLRWAFKAGAGGHNGVSSVIEALGEKDFYRLRLGIGRPKSNEDPKEYVLQAFQGDDLKIAEELCEKAVHSVNDFLKHGLQWVQNRYH